MGRKRNKKQILNKETRVKDLYKYFNTKDDNEVIEKTFSLINYEIDNYHNKTDSKRIIIGLNLISAITDQKENIDKYRFQNELYKLYNKIDNYINKRSTVYATKDFKKVRHSVDELSEVVTLIKDNLMSEYDLVEYIIYESKNHYYLKNVFHFLKDSVNAKDENNKSIAFNTINHLLDLINKKGLKDDIYYFDKVIDIMFSIEEIKFDEEEKRKCLNKLYDTSLNLKKHDRLYNAKKDVLVNLKENITKDIHYKKDIKGLEKKCNIKRGFSREVLQELKPNKDYQNNRPKVALDDYIISIDSKNAIEIDDAQSCVKLDNGNYLLGFHNASVTLYYDYNSKIVKNAIEKGENIYCGRRTVPIFPTEFSGNKGSLLQGIPKFANSHFMEISPSGDIVNQHLVKSIIMNHYQTNYKNVGKVIINGSNNKRFENTINNLVDVTKIIAKRYNYDIYVDHNNPEEFANQMVLFSTLLHNEEVANFFYNNNYPMIYRVKDKNDAKDINLQNKIEEFCKCHPTNNKENMIKGILCYDEESYYATKGSHAGLKIDHYTHFSSPLRRAADIVAENAVDAFYFNLLTEKEKYDFEDSLEYTIKTLNNQNENIKTFKKEIKNYKTK